MIGINSDLRNQMETLHDIIKENSIIYEFISKCQTLGLEQYYIGAGCIAQTVWNYQSNNDLMYGISDIDFVYFDSTDLSYEKEEEISKKAIELADNKVNIDVKNEARVHLWYKSHFGYDIEPYSSVEHAINTWPTTATSIGVRLEHGKFIIYAPFGLNDLFGRIVKANKVQITEEIFKIKASKWLSKWSDLIVIPW